MLPACLTELGVYILVQTIEKVIDLPKSFRCADEQFCAVLNDIRTGNVTDTVCNLIASRKVDGKSLMKSGPVVKLVGLKRDAESHNQKMLSQLSTKSHSWEAEDKGVSPGVCTSEYIAVVYNCYYIFKKLCSVSTCSN